jgi:hypothetical protein
MADERAKESRAILSLVYKKTLLLLLFIHSFFLIFLRNDLSLSFPLFGKKEKITLIERFNQTVVLSF